MIRGGLVWPGDIYEDIDWLEHPGGNSVLSEKTEGEKVRRL